jgi:hypothetical protein
MYSADSIDILKGWIMKECQKKSVTARMEGTRKVWGLMKLQEDRSNGNKNGHAVARNRKEWRRTVLESDVHNRL